MRAANVKVCVRRLALLVEPREEPGDEGAANLYIAQRRAPVWAFCLITNSRYLLCTIVYEFLNVEATARVESSHRHHP